MRTGVVLARGARRHVRAGIVLARGPRRHVRAAVVLARGALGRRVVPRHLGPRLLYAGGRAVLGRRPALRRVDLRDGVRRPHLALQVGHLDLREGAHPRGGGRVGFGHQLHAHVLRVEQAVEGGAARVHARDPLEQGVAAREVGARHERFLLRERVVEAAHELDGRRATHSGPLAAVAVRHVLDEAVFVRLLEVGALFLDEVDVFEDDAFGPRLHAPQPVLVVVGGHVPEALVVQRAESALAQLHEDVQQALPRLGREDSGSHGRSVRVRRHGDYRR